MSDRPEDRLNGLRELPTLAPPAALEARTLSAMAEAASGRPKGKATGSVRRFAMAAIWIVATGAAVLLSFGTLDEGPADEQGTAPVSRSPVADADFVALAEQSALLELMLAELPPQRPVMRVSTAGTIVGLEDRLALLDAELVRANTDAPEYRVALMRDRVEVMNALVSVRYAQSRAFTY